MVDMSKEEGGQEVDMSKEEGGQEVDVMSKEKEKGGEDHEELPIMEDDDREASKKDVGQDMDTMMQTLDALVENIVPPTTTAKMPPVGEKKRKMVKAISPSSLIRRVKEGRRTSLPSMKSVEIIADENNFLQMRFGLLTTSLIPPQLMGEISKEGFLEIFGLDTSEWPIVVPTPCPQQGVGDDCALFVCKYMECLSKKNIIGLSFSQADMDLIRGKLACAIIEEVNLEKAHKSSGEEAAEKVVSLLDEA
ncbi:hypothetical protein Taro_041821 [Colocasia esculenta]|uniref:Ubiquitin-like protease family profile domain-containing protein n=1 Tax=Colocasia esculenta TaxID=4460 RepID=A0A843WGV2_COLES|nr:hypothetical protein [Colocasia esculenta]